MPITSDLGGKNYTLGRGKLYGSRFTPAQVAAGIVAATMPQGELYFGNTPGIALNSSEETLDHFDSDSGVRVKDDSVSLQFDAGGSFQCDNISKENIALLLLSDGAGTVTQSSATAATYVTPAVKRGMFYQIGQTSSLPSGVRAVSNIIVKKGSPGFATTVTQSGNYEVDEALGRVWVLPESPDIPDDTILQITYDAAAGTRDQIISGSTAIYMALHYIADNPRGVNRDYLWPLVKITPDGDYDLKGDDWNTINFTFEVLKKASNIGRTYVDGRQA